MQPTKTGGKSDGTSSRERLDNSHRLLHRECCLSNVSIIANFGTSSGNGRVGGGEGEEGRERTEASRTLIAISRNNAGINIREEERIPSNAIDFRSLWNENEVCFRVL